MIDYLEFGDFIHGEYENSNVNFDDVDLLPLFHTTNQNTLDLILYNKKIASSSEKGNYFFYGDAVYKKTQKIGFNNNNLPVGIAFFETEHFKMDNYIINCFPFDSDGFHLYNVEVFKNTHFKLKPPSAETIKKFVSSFFGSNTNYLNKKISKELDEAKFIPCRVLKELVNIYKMAKSPANPEYDVRSLTIEVICEDIIGKTPDWIIVPDENQIIVPDRTQKEDDHKAKQYANRLIIKHNIGAINVRFYTCFDNGSEVSRDYDLYISQIREEAKSIVNQNKNKWI